MIRRTLVLLVFALFLAPSLFPGGMARSSCTSHRIDEVIRVQACDTDYDSLPDTFDAHVDESDTHVGTEASRERYKSPQQRNTEVVVSSGYPVAPSAGVQVTTVDWGSDLHHEGIYASGGFDTRLSGAPSAFLLVFMEDRNRDGSYTFPNVYLCFAPELGCNYII